MVNFWTPVSCQERNFFLSSDTSFKKFLILSHSSTDDILVVASDTAIKEGLILRCFFNGVILFNFNVGVPFTFLELSWSLRSFLALGRFFGLSLALSNLSFLHWL